MDWLKLQVIPETFGYILSFRVHVCSSEHYSDLSFVYRFVSLLYTSGTLTTYFLCNIEVCTELKLLNENNRSVSVHMYARSNHNWMSVLGASRYARNNHYSAYMRRALKYARSNHYWTHMLGASNYARSNHYLAYMLRAFKYARNNHYWTHILGASNYARSNHYWAYMLRAFKDAWGDHNWTFVLGVSKYARNNYWTYTECTMEHHCMHVTDIIWYLCSEHRSKYGACSELKLCTEQQFWAHMLGASKHIYGATIIGRMHCSEYQTLHGAAIIEHICSEFEHICSFESSK